MQVFPLVNSSTLFYNSEKKVNKQNTLLHIDFFLQKVTILSFLLTL